MKALISKLLIISLLIFLLMCSKETENIKKYNVTGKAQKGPFVIGTNVTISELDDDLNPTGKIYFSTIMNNEGYFEIPNIEFASSYVQLKIEGNHYNENIGLTFNNEPITLYCIADLSQINKTNINLLTHLEKDRLIKYKQDGLGFNESKFKAQKEILTIFNLDNFNIQNSEILDIANLSDDNGILLATTVIIQGNLKGMFLTEFLTKIRSDINDNGTLNSEELQTQLISQAKLLHTPDVRENLESYYMGLDNEYEIPQFEKYIDTFIVKSQYKSTVNYFTPESTINGINLLSIEDDTIYVDTLSSYSLSVITDVNSNISYWADIARLEGSGEWFYLSNISNWNIDLEDPNRWFGFNISFEPNITADMKIRFRGKGLAQLHISIGTTDYQYIGFEIDRYIIWGN